MKFFVVIKYLGSYYIQKESKNSTKLEFPELELDDSKHYSSNDFDQSNVDIKKDIADVIIHKTPFRNRSWAGENAYKAVSLRTFRVKDDPKGRDYIRVAIFSSNDLNMEKKNEFIPYVSGLKGHCNETTKNILKKLKFQNNWSFLLFYLPFFPLFLLPFIPGVDVPFNSDALQFVYTALGGAVLVLDRFFPTERYLKRFNNCPVLGNIPMFYFLLFAGMLIFSCAVSRYIPEMCNQMFSKIGLLILLIDSAIELYQREM